MPGTLTRWDPFGELGELRSRFDRMFEELAEGRERGWTPAIDVVRENGNLVLHADIPAISPRRSRSRSRTTFSRSPVSTRSTRNRRTSITYGASAATGP